MLGRAEKAASFDVKYGISKVGELHVSKGGVRWYPADSKGGHHKLTWKQFADLMEEQKKSK
jgi:hypothetical protein